MTAPRFARVAGRLFNAPLAITPDKAEMLVLALADRMGFARVSFNGHQPQAFSFLDDEDEGDAVATQSILEVVEGVAIISVSGTLVHKLGTVRAWCGMQGYDGLAIQLREALNDPTVRAIWLDVDSPGGEVAGCFDFADEVFASNARSGGKPIWAFINEQACSAAYAIASQADRVLTPRTGISGSVGVVMMHVDWSKALAADGVKVSLLHSGAHKVDGNPYEPLSQEVRADLQAMLDKSRLLFAQTVARGRRMNVESVLATEARWYEGDGALSVGFADAVTSEAQGFDALLRELSRGFNL